MLKYRIRTFFFTFYTYALRAFLILTGRRNKIINYHKGFFRLIAFFKKRFSYKINNSIIIYDPVYSGIGWPIYFTGSFEDTELAICSRFIKSDSVIADIGANIGLHTIYFSEIAKDGLVYSFEPSQYTYSYLINNVRKKNNILPVNVALSDKNGIVSFFDCENDALSSLKNTSRSEIRNESKVICFSGDIFFNALSTQKLDFIKIDVEGFEQEVIEGLKSTIVKFHPVIFCEIYKGSNSNNNPEQTISLIAGLGYSVFVVSDNELKPFVNHKDNEHNYFFIPNKSPL